MAMARSSADRVETTIKGSRGTAAVGAPFQDSSIESWTIENLHI
jgi:hypothetical protein